MAYPTTIVEIAFDGTPYDVSPTWTAVTSYVRLVNTSRGRSDDFTDFDTGTAQIVLDNRTRLFDPFYTSGTYYGKLLPRKQIRVRATSGATTYDVFRGYIAGWPVSFTEAGLDSTVTLQCFDALGLLATETITDDWYETYLRATMTPTQYFKCNDNGNQTSLANGVTGGASLVAYPGLPYFVPVQPLLNGITGTAASCSIVTNTLGSNATPTAMAFSWISLNAQISSPYTGSSICYVTYNKGYMFFAAYFNPTGTQVRFTYARTNDTGRWSFTVAAGNYNSTTPHHFLFTTDTSGTNPKIYQDGVDISNWTYTTGSTDFLTVEYVQVNNNNVQEIAVNNTGGITPTQVSTLYQYALGLKNETTYARAQALVAQTSFTNVAYSTNYSATTNYANAIENTGQFLPQLRTVQNTEGGDIFCKKDGSVFLTDRQYIFTNTKSSTVQAAFSDAGGATLKYGKELTLDYDADNIRNSVTVNFTSGYLGANNYIANNTTSTASVGKVSDTIDTYLPDLTAATTLADFQLAIGAALKPRVSPLEVGVTSQTADWQTLLGLELLERITVTRTPTTGNAITQTMLINSIDHTIRPGVWETTITGSTRYTGWFTLDVSALDGTDILV
jgi:hypothetical protein